jgi:quinol monooxygenase YgiN
MFVAEIHIHVKPEFVESFKIATLDNARNSVNESGIARFDVYQQTDDHTRFTLIEIYRSEDAPFKHRETPHYIRWRDKVADMMVEPRMRVTYNVLFPSEAEL